MKIVAIGGSSEFVSKDLAITELELIFSKYGITESAENVLIYGIGYGDGVKIAEEWAFKRGYRYKDGSPKFSNTIDASQAVAFRNEVLSEHCSFLVILKKGSNTGGNSIIEAFTNANKPVHVVEDFTIVQESRVNLFKDCEYNPSQSPVEFYSTIAKDLLKTSVTLDTETTGLSAERDDIIELAIVDSGTNEVICDTLVHSTVPVSPHAYAVNNIHNSMLKDKPTLTEVWNSVRDKVKDKVIIASYAVFDEKMLRAGLVRRGMEAPENSWACLQALYCRYAGIPSSRLSTAKIAKSFGIEPGTHRALADVQAQVSILQAMAEKIIPKRV